MLTAIVGIGCRFPGGADTPAEFWDLLRTGTDATTEVPPGRFGTEAEIAGHCDRTGMLTCGSWAGSSTGSTPSTRTSSASRHVRRVASTPSSACSSRSSGRRSRTAGCLWIDSPVRAWASTWASPRTTTPTSRCDPRIAISSTRTSIPAAQGASPPTASPISSTSEVRALPSTLRARRRSRPLHLACRGLASEECDIAVVGAVNALLAAEPTIGFRQAAMLAPDGRCKPFDAAANGYVRSEGAGAIVLKPLDRAVD